MTIKASNLASSRREFLLNVLPAGTLFCLGCGNLSAMASRQNTKKTDEKKHKFLEDSGMSTTEVFQFAYQVTYVPLLEQLSDQIGHDRFVEMLKKASSGATAQQAKGSFKDMPNRNLASLSDLIINMVKANPYKNALTYEIIEKTDKAFELRYSECLFAKTFREANAPDIGYATLCYPDYALVQAFNPKLKMVRTKNLMRGDDCCNPRIVWEG